MSSRLRIDERREPDGGLVSTWLIEEGGRVALLDETGETAGVGGRTLRLPAGAVAAVFARYGKPLGVELPPDTREGPGVAIPLGDGAAATVRAFAFRPFGWVEPADYLLFEGPGAEPLAAPAKLVSAALRALGRAASRG